MVKESHMSVDIQAVIQEKEKTHGDYGAFTNALTGISAILQSLENYQNLSYSERASIHEIIKKLCRITGGTSCEDHWLDIMGYAHLQLTNTNWKKKR